MPLLIGKPDFLAGSILSAGKRIHGIDGRIHQIQVTRSLSCKVAHPFHVFADKKTSQNRKMGAHVEAQAAQKIIRFIAWVAAYKRYDIRRTNLYL